MAPSDSSTVAQSNVPSVLDHTAADVPSAKEKDVAVDSDNEKSPVEKLDDEDEEDVVAPPFVKLLLITLALCFAVFCMALVRSIEPLL